MVGYCLDVYHDRAPPPRFLISKSANGGADGGCNGASAGPPTFPSPLFLPLRPACAFGSPSLRRSVAIKAFRSASAVAALYRGEARGEGERREIGSDPANGRPGRGDLILLDMTVGGACRRRMAVWKSSCNISLKGERSRVLGNVGSRPCRIYDWMILLIMGAFAKVVK